MGPRAGLDGCGKSASTGIRTPHRPARSESLYKQPTDFHETSLALPITSNLYFQHPVINNKQTKQTIVKHCYQCISNASRNFVLKYLKNALFCRKHTKYMTAVRNLYLSFFLLATPLLTGATYVKVLVQYGRSSKVAES